jgi:hypothetical protein
MWQTSGYLKRELSAAEKLAIQRSLEERAAMLQLEPVAHSPQKMEFYGSQWSDSASQAEAQWREVFEELTASRLRAVPDFELPPGWAFDIAEKILQWLKLAGAMNPPEITLDGDGSLYLEWQSNNKHLTICLSGSFEGSYIYLGEGEEYNAYPLTITSLQEAMHSYRA